MEFETRLVDSRLSVEFGILNDSLHTQALEEYNALTQLHKNSIENWLHSLKLRSGDCKCGAGSVVLGEMLVHIYKKIEHLEHLITKSQVSYIPLESIAHSTKLGHGIIILDSAQLIINEKYYARIMLPIFPARCVPIFATAKENNVLQVTKIGDQDLKDYDSYIVSIEREMLKARKLQKSEKENHEYKDI